MTWQEKLLALGPCPEPYRWAIKHKTLRQAWRMCERSDWMLWLIDEVDESARDKMADILDEVMWNWGEEDSINTNVNLVEAYIILDFMPDPPKLP